MRIAVVIISVFALATCALGQQTSDDFCPTISVTGPSFVVKPGEIATYTVTVDKRGLSITPVYKWSVSAGTIVSGQGTEKIGVRTASWNTTVTVEIQGLPPGCPNLASETGEGPNAPLAKKIATVTGPLGRANFAGIIGAAERDPSAQLYIVISGTSRNRIQSVRNKRNGFSKGLRQLNAQGRLTFLESTREDDRAVIWLVPVGATPPLP